MEDITIKQTRGPAIYSKGELICETEFRTSAGLMALEVWETAGGALIGMSRMDYDSGDLDVRGCVVEPQDDRGAMQREVMEFFGWADRARSMVRKQTDWDLRLRVA